jgi:hypothetical protein
MGNTFQNSISIDNNLETYSLIWLDARVNKTQENIKSQEKLRTLINYLKTFDDARICEGHIRSLSENDRIVFIVSGRLGQELVPRIHQLRQIFSIYVYCYKKQDHEQWANQFIKVNLNDDIYLFIFSFIGTRCFC